MSINWKKHKFNIENLAESNKTNELIANLCKNYALDIQALLQFIKKDSEEFEYFTNLQKALNKIEKKYETKQTKGVR